MITMDSDEDIFLTQNSFRGQENYTDGEGDATPTRMLELFAMAEVDLDNLGVKNGGIYLSV